MLYNYVFFRIVSSCLVYYLPVTLESNSNVRWYYVNSVTGCASMRWFLLAHIGQKVHAYYPVPVCPWPLLFRPTFSGEIRRPCSGHALLLPSPRKRGVGKALVKQVTEVIGRSLG